MDENGCDNRSEQMYEVLSQVVLRSAVIYWLLSILPTY